LAGQQKVSMIRTLGFLVLFFIVINCSAQLNLSGKVTNQEHKILPFVTIKISDSKNRVNYTQTDSLGFYQFNNLQAGKYAITYAALNFNAENRLLTLSRDTLINIQLQENPNKLTDVQINAKKALIEKEIDRTVFNIGNSVSAIGTDALELLSKVPGIRVLNDRVSLVGRSGVNIMINDKLVPLSDDELSNYLKSISSGNIAKIEVITNPPAKYDAQGNNGLISGKSTIIIMIAASCGSSSVTILAMKKLSSRIES
jgi:hypothetical protein